MSSLAHPAARRRDHGLGWAVARIATVDMLIGAGIVLLLASPLLFTDSGFGGDFVNHLWLTWTAGKSLVSVGHPTYFLNTNDRGVFDPWFAFYGGTLYMAAGGLGQLLAGNQVLAFTLVTALAIAGAYGGTLWLAHQSGLRGWIGHAPALVVVTSAYYVSDLYGRGAWPEFVAVSSLAPLLASTVNLVRTPAWRPGPLLIFVLSAVVFSGSHSISLLWGTTVVVVGACIYWLAVGRLAPLPLGRLVSVAALGLASACLNAWFLLPTLAYERYTQIDALVRAGIGYGYFDRPLVLFDPLRYVPSQSAIPGLFVQIPVWFFAWAMLTGAVLLRRQHATALRRWAVALISIVLLLGLMGFLRIWSVIPPPLDEIQYPYRLDSYVTYAVSALVMVAGLALQQADGGRRLILRSTLVATCAISVALCAWQLWIPNLHSRGDPYRARGEALRSVTETPVTGAIGHDYNDARSPLVSVPHGRSLIIDPNEVKGDRYSAWTYPPPGLGPIQTNIAGGSYLVHIDGLVRIGRDRAGFAVVRRTKPGGGPVHVAIETTHSTLLKLALLISILAGLAVLLAYLTAVRRSLLERLKPHGLACRRS